MRNYKCDLLPIIRAWRLKRKHCWHIIFVSFAFVAQQARQLYSRGGFRFESSRSNGLEIRCNTYAIMADIIIYEIGSFISPLYVCVLACLDVFILRFSVVFSSAWGSWFTISLKAKPFGMVKRFLLFAFGRSDLHSTLTLRLKIFWDLNTFLTFRQDNFMSSKNISQWNPFFKLWDLLNYLYSPPPKKKYVFEELFLWAL